MVQGLWILGPTVDDDVAILKAVQGNLTQDRRRQQQQEVEGQEVDDKEGEHHKTWMEAREEGDEDVILMSDG